MPARRLLVSTVTATAALASIAAGVSTASAGSADRTGPVTHKVSAAEHAATARLDIASIVKSAKPMPMPTAKGGAPSQSSLERGAEFKVGPVAPQSSATSKIVNGVADSYAGSLWPLGRNANPNRQVGKYFFQTPGGWSWCTATVVTAANKSTLVTAGHCVVNPSTKGWYTNSFFQPGYQYGASTMGTWYGRQMWTTSGYYYNAAYADDMAAVALSTNAKGAIQNTTGSQGIWFNGPAGGLMRTALGYPKTDSRWPGYTANGEDARYCQWTNTYYSSGTWAGQEYLPCYMTGGASGGPHLSWVNSSWMGYVNSVNSNKGGIGSSWRHVMFGPYFGNAEGAVYNAAQGA